MLLKYLINMDRKTKIIATVGPSLSSESKIKKIIDTGANVLRINFSHGTLEDHENVISWARKSNMQVAIMQDIQGPKIRTGISSENTFLEKSKNVTLTNIETESNNDIVFINYENLLRDVNVDDRVFIDDGQIVLKVVEKENDKLEPYNFYCWTKLCVEKIVSSLDQYIIIRTRFFDKNNFKYKNYATDIYSSSIEVSKLAENIEILLKKTL